MLLCCLLLAAAAALLCSARYPSAAAQKLLHVLVLYCWWCWFCCRADSPAWCVVVACASGRISSVLSSPVLSCSASRGSSGSVFDNSFSCVFHLGCR